MHPIIRNPEAISDEEIPQAQAQVPSSSGAASSASTSSSGAASSTSDTFSGAAIAAIENILKFTTGLAIHTCAGCQGDITHDQKANLSNMVFMKKGMVAFYNLKCNRI